MNSKPPINIEDVRSSVDGDLSSVAGNIDGKSVFFESSDIKLNASMEAYFCLALVPCMRLQRDCVVNGQISQKLLESSEAIQEMLNEWEPKLRKIRVLEAEPVRYPPDDKQRVGLFFSGGFDSFYSLFKHQEIITDIIFINGFDIELSKREFRDEILDIFVNVAEELGVNFIEVSTNFNEFLIPLAPPTWSYGAMLASVGHVLSKEFSQFFISADFDYARIRPAGTHLNLDPLWGTESLTFVHDGCEANRLEKVASLADSDLVAKRLRVCFKSVEDESPDGFYNCGQCEKCLRSMTALLIHDCLEENCTFAKPLNLELISKLRVIDEDHLDDWQDCLEALEQSNRFPELKAAIYEALTPPSFEDLKPGMNVEVNLESNSDGILLATQLVVKPRLYRFFIEAVIAEFAEDTQTVSLLGRQFSLSEFDTSNFRKDKRIRISINGFNRVNKEEIDDVELAPSTCVTNRMFGSIERIDLARKSIEIFGISIALTDKTQLDRDGFAVHQGIEKAREKILSSVVLKNSLTNSSH